eukprot:NODE_684_length_1856_cov_12.940786_g555_i0.p3 GENE.NODE_684_length_1856_cov_12.940786_g555_i0~~NODE_684_length_1856_cov_12.940786_g555_i0.p3  ORF type:complete len:185 (-),score=14.37 NODE_684_length_1856_cov_12.940786_g555_i0:103-657(-)
MTAAPTVLLPPEASQNPGVTLEIEAPAVPEDPSVDMSSPGPFSAVLSSAHGESSAYNWAPSLQLLLIGGFVILVIALLCFSAMCWCKLYSSRRKNCPKEQAPPVEPRSSHYLDTVMGQVVDVSHNQGRALEHDLEGDATCVQLEDGFAQICAQLPATPSPPFRSVSPLSTPATVVQSPSPSPFK